MTSVIKYALCVSLPAPRGTAASPAGTVGSSIITYTRGIETALIRWLPLGYKTSGPIASAWRRTYLLLSLVVWSLAAHSFRDGAPFALAPAWGVSLSSRCGKQRLSRRYLRRGNFFPRRAIFIFREERYARCITHLLSRRWVQKM